MECLLAGGGEYRRVVGIHGEKQPRRLILRRLRERRVRGLRGPAFLPEPEFSLGIAVFGTGNEELPKSRVDHHPQRGAGENALQTVGNPNMLVP